jgi:N6-adenosine-specific RNA methylase IME4
MSQEEVENIISLNEKYNGNLNTVNNNLDKKNYSYEENLKNENDDEDLDKKKEVWVNSIKADGGAYKGCPKNDYCQHFVDTGDRPQNFIRDYEEEKRFLDYPKLNELIKRKNEVLQKRATPPMWIKCDLKTFDLSTLGKFDVVLIDPPIPEYARRAEGLGIDTSNLSPWSFEELSNLRIDSLAENCCFLFLWVGSSEGMDRGRLLLKKWNFRRCEDIVWIKTNKYNFKRRFYNDNDTLIQHTKEHCLVGIRGQVKRGVDGHFIHANIDTDVIVSEEPPLGSTEKPQELYRIIERFCLGRKRIELFGEDHNRRPGWLTLGKSLSSTNFDIDKYNSFFKGELCYPAVQGYEGGRFVGCTPEIENLRPRSPSRNQPINNRMASNMPTPNSQNNLINNFGIGFNSGMNYGVNSINQINPINQMTNYLGYNNFMWNQNAQDLSRVPSYASLDYSSMGNVNNNLINQGYNNFRNLNVISGNFPRKEQENANLVYNNTNNFNQNS